MSPTSTRRAPEVRAQRRAVPRLPRGTVRVLTAVRSRTDRVRQRSIACAAAGMGVALLLAVAVATIGGRVEQEVSTVTRPDGTTAVEVRDVLLDAEGGLAPFLAEPGLRSGSTLAALLLLLPFAALGVQALRVGRVVDERRARRLALAGATPKDLRRLRATRTAAAFGWGGLLAGPVYVVVWLVLGLLLPAGARLVPTPTAWIPSAWIVIGFLLYGVGRLIGSLDTGDRGGPLRPSGGRRVPSWTSVAITCSAGAALLGVPFAGRNDVTTAVALFAGVVLLLIGVGAGAARLAAAAPVSGRVRPRPRDAAVTLLARAQRRGSLVAVTGTAGVLFVCGLSFGFESVLVTELLATSRSDVTFYVAGAALAAAVGVVAAVVAIASLVLSLTDHLLGNRRPVAATAALGTEPHRLVRVQAESLRRTAVPPVVLGVLVVAVPATGAGIVRWAAGTSDVVDPWWQLLPLLTAGVAGLLVALAGEVLARAMRSRVRAAAALENLRTP